MLAGREVPGSTCPADQHGDDDAHCHRRAGAALRGSALAALAAFGTSLLAWSLPPAWGQSPPDVAAAIDDLVAANRILYRQGVVDGFGHISIRHPERKDRFLMSASLAPGRVSKADIMEFDLEGKPLDQRDRSIYSERFIHSEIYKARPDVNAVLHSHSPTVIPFSVRRCRCARSQQRGFLAPNVPVFEMRSVAARAAFITDGMRGKALAETGDRRSRSCAVTATWWSADRPAGGRARSIPRSMPSCSSRRSCSGALIYIDAEEGKAGEGNRDRNETGHATDRIWQLWVEGGQGFKHRSGRDKR
jgi:HCOMODA/2-hydroxy-3-carboxy-muconic semialdehyde decarboxylase